LEHTAVAAQPFHSNRHGHKKLVFGCHTEIDNRTIKCNPKSHLSKPYLLVNLVRDEVQQSHQRSDFIGLDGQRCGINGGMHIGRI